MLVVAEYVGVMLSLHVSDNCLPFNVLFSMTPEVQHVPACLGAELPVFAVP